MTELEPTKKDLEVLWTTKQVAEYFGVRTRTVYDWIRRGKVLDPARTMKVGNRVRIPRSEIMRIANNKRLTLIEQGRPYTLKKNRAEEKLIQTLSPEVKITPIEQLKKMAIPVETKKFATPL